MTMFALWHCAGCRVGAGRGLRRQVVRSFGNPAARAQSRETAIGAERPDGWLGLPAAIHRRALGGGLPDLDTGIALLTATRYM